MLKNVINFQLYCRCDIMYIVQNYFFTLFQKLYYKILEVRDSQIQ
jgi:hypothetical protein